MAGQLPHRVGPLLLAAVVIGLSPAASRAAVADRLEDCQMAVEAFPPRPCADEPLPAETHDQMGQLRALLDPTAARVGRRAHLAASLLHQVQAASTEAERDGRLSSACARVLHGMLRNAEACVARPLLRERHRAERAS